MVIDAKLFASTPPSPPLWFLLYYFMKQLLKTSIADQSKVACVISQAATSYERKSMYSGVRNICIFNITSTMKETFDGALLLFLEFIQKFMALLAFLPKCL